jgi:hypothetical protein
MLVSTFVAGQNFEVPPNYQFNTKDDYSGYEKKIIEATNWLHATPFNEQKEKRQEVSAFVVKWINGSPTVNVEINPIIMDFEEKNPGMLTLYMRDLQNMFLKITIRKICGQSTKRH